jgi:uncharacterized membrane protein
MREVSDWLNGFVPGAPGLVEALDQSGAAISPVARRTGLPTIIAGAEYAVAHGVPEEDLRRRIDTVRTIYESPSPDEAFSLLRGYGVELVLVSSVERSVYSLGDFEKFKARPDLFALVYSAEGLDLYAAAFSPLFVVRE